MEYMNDIIDTAPFQRLRRIIQTSYSPLYSSALHNRFVHSIGVYHMGELAANVLQREIPNCIEDITDDIYDNLNETSEVFKLACLLHDVGHAPFSHTGEGFYLNADGAPADIHAALIHSVGSKSLEDDITSGRTGEAAPHEIMSAIIGIKEYGKYLNSVERKELFARCITGYLYPENSQLNCIRNCYISVLNSKVIDVDKLDYLIRDAYTTGYNTVSIDYVRLLDSLTVDVSENEKKVELAYYKDAVSVLENVVYAHDSERKWIQNHPIVLYECYLLQRVIRSLNDKIYSQTQEKLFSEKALSSEGIEVKEGLRVRLLCDDDIIFLMKNVYPSDLSREYFERKRRRHPVWKSEAEYKALIYEDLGVGNFYETFQNAMDATAKYLANTTDTGVINESSMKKLQEDLKKIEEAENSETDVDQDTLSAQRDTKENIWMVMQGLHEYTNTHNIEFNFVVLEASQFNSGFLKPNFSNTKIIFSTGNGEYPMTFGKVATPLKAQERQNEKFYYLFYERLDQYEEDDLDKEELCKTLAKQFFNKMKRPTRKRKK